MFSSNKRCFCFWLLLLLPAWTIAQNLVPNPSFEQRIKPACLYLRFSENLKEYLVDWYTPTGGTSDVWSTDPLLSADCSQYLGPQKVQPHSGQVCVGMYTYTVSGRPYREYIQVKLKQPMRRGQMYHVSMYVALLNSLRMPSTQGGSVHGNVASNNLGIYVSADSLTIPQSSPYYYGQLLSVSPQVNDDALLDDPGSWIKIERCFVAQQDYNYLTIGNFFDDKNTHISPTQSEFADQRAYYLVDDVSIELVANPPALVNLGRDTTLCAGQSLSFALADTANTQYRWQDNSTLPRYTARTTGVYQVTATRGGCPVSDTLRLTVAPSVRLPNDTTLCRGEELILDAANALDAYVWSTGSTNATITVTTAGVYSIRIPSATCFIADTVRVAVVDCPGVVPNVFTPNGDGKNDVFYIANIQFTPWQLAVFNRWGRQVYQTNAYANDWTGNDLPAGLYYYLLQSDALKRTLKGWVELLK